MYIVQTVKTLRLYCNLFGMNFDALVNLNFLREIHFYSPLSSCIKCILSNFIKYRIKAQTSILV